MTRRKLLYSLFRFHAPVYPCYWEPRWLDLTHRQVKFRGVPSEGPIRILHLADLHASMFVPLSMIHHAITVGLAQKPDLICLTGDFITHRQDFDMRGYTDALRRLSAGRADIRGPRQSRWRQLDARGTSAIPITA